MFPVTEADLDGDGSPTCAGDCNDANPSRYPGAPELCDGLDNDCNGVVPGAESDADRDLYRVCHGDCDDLVPSRHPGAPELCDGLDNDCDGVVPGAESDADHDSYRVCDGDCADSDAAIFPGAPEVCDGLDNDCDGFVDSGASLIPSRIEPSTINIRAGGNAFSVELTFTCGGTSFDPVLVGPVHVSRISSYLFPDPFGLACPSGGLLAPERGIVDNIAARVLTGAGRLSMKFDRAPDGNCSTLDGDRPSLFPFLLGGGEFQEICLAGSFGAQPFETCSTVKVIQPN
jgi:hypothetical protein